VLFSNVLAETSGYFFDSFADTGFARFVKRQGVRISQLARIEGQPALERLHAGIGMDAPQMVSR
jgi:hypothetical protein